MCLYEIPYTCEALILYWHFSCNPCQCSRCIQHPEYKKQGLKWLDRETDHSSPFSVEVKNVKTCNSTPPNAFVACTGTFIILHIYESYAHIKLYDFLLVYMAQDSEPVLQVAMVWTVRNSNRSAWKRFSLLYAPPDRHLGPPSFLHSGYRISFPGVKWQGRRFHPLSGVEVKNEYGYMSSQPLCLYGVLRDVFYVVWCIK
jgi:hypothetical protein